MNTIKSDLVVKSNRLIEASYRLDLTEQRLILLAIQNSRETQQGINSEDLLTITASEYASQFNINVRTAYEQLKNACDTLFYRHVVLHDIHKPTNSPRQIKTRWVAAIAYVEKAAIVQIQFSSMIVPYITRLESEFTSYKIQSVSQMTSSYAIRLYELIVQWGKIGRREISLVDLKVMLDIQAEKTYERLDRFKAKVIDIAVNQINEYSDLTVTYGQRKSGRTVTHLIFSFQEKHIMPPIKAEKSKEVKLNGAKSQKTSLPAKKVITPEAIQPDNRFNNFLALPQEEQEQLRVLFNEGLSSPLRDMWKKYRADNTENPEFKPMFKAAFLDMLKQFEI